MRVWEKLFMNREELEKNGPITIVAFGDSVTHGALKTDEINYETVYWNVLKQKLNAVRNYVPVNVINAGIGGANAAGSLCRLERDVVRHSPDLVIVCFGLNDVNSPLDEYIGALRKIFEKCKACGAQVVFMTPNMLNTYVADDTENIYKEYAAVTAEYQNSGRMDLYVSEAIKAAREAEAEVCDCYGEWKRIAEDEDTTLMLINRINHPTPEMHKLFADKLFELICEDTDENNACESMMYNGG